ncbi:MFS transporter [Lysobacter sp. TY2-98]|uniref:MFS transporter n=1 Tax=Lysobacter sp. TY2-98 TaxID=2290922 RepID=UPI000E205144|nr:MFS transporter [Lysobacter sp. TY2-98]AXK72258.1 MFS transporter [Lysobacter sp. TY2-98]
MTEAAAAPSPMRVPAFVALMGYRILTILSYQIVSVAVGWQIYQLTRDPLKLGLVGLAEVIPYFCVAPFAGYLVDHLPRRKLGMVACLGLALTPLVLALVSMRLRAGSPLVFMYGAVALTGAVRSFLGPVYNALFGRVLVREQYTRGASIGSIVFQSGLVLGPAIGGALVGAGSIVVAYAVAMALAFAASLSVVSLRVTEPAQQMQRGPIFRSIGEGIRFVFSHQILLGALALDMFAVLFGGAISLAPAFIHDVLHRGPEALGILRGAPALGAVLVGVYLARRPLERHAGRILLCAVAGFGLCMIGFGLSTSFWLSAAILLLSGMCDGVSVVLRSTILQLATPDDMRGRVSSINGIFIGSSNELGAFWSGAMARLMGLVPSVVFGGFMTLAVVASTGWRAPKLRRLDLRELR